MRLQQFARLNTVSFPDERPVVSLESVEGGTGRLIVCELPTSVGNTPGLASIEPGDVLFGKLRPYLAKSWLAVFPAHASMELLCLRPNRRIVEPRWLSYLVMSQPFLDWATASSDGTKMPRTSWERLRAFDADLPAVVYQRAITEFLDAETERIDRLQNLRRKQLDLLDERESAVVDLAFNFPDAQNSRLGRFVQVQTGLTVDAARSASDDDVELPYLRVANVQPGRLDLATVTKVRLPRQLAQSSTLCYGDVLMTEGGDIDKLGRGTVWRNELPDCLHQNHVFAVRPGIAIASDFLALFTRTSAARAHFESTGVQSTNLASTSASKVRDLRLPVVSKAEQVNVVRKLARSLQRLRDLRLSLCEAAALATERRRALITAAVTGQLDLACEIAEEAS